MNSGRTSLELPLSCIKYRVLPGKEEAVGKFRGSEGTRRHEAHEAHGKRGHEDTRACLFLKGATTTTGCRHGDTTGTEGAALWQNKTRDA